jgi:hypothetical protein
MEYGVWSPGKKVLGRLILKSEPRHQKISSVLTGVCLSFSKNKSLKSRIVDIEYLNIVLEVYDDAVRFDVTRRRWL